MYFPFFNKKSKPPVPSLLIDVHSHLIPGIDDGARDMEESLALLSALESAGYQKVITTPHIMVDSYRNTREIIMQGLSLLTKEAKKAGIKVQIEAAAEYYLDDGFLAHLHSADILLVGGEYVLFETSYIAKPLCFDVMVDEMIAIGYKPLLAHPERYRYIQNFDEYQSMKAKGIYFQININSFGGHYGKDAKVKANFLNKSGMIDFLGSDTHHMKQIQTMEILKDTSIYRSIFKHNIILNNIL